MAFQFECPQGHLLEGEESQANTAINCPVCGMLFLVPDPPAPQPVQPAAQVPEEPAEPELLHIACPNGHELEVPPEMLDTEVLCPQCQVQFRLRARDSREHKAKREKQEELRDAKMNKFWFNFSITAAVLVGLLLLTLVIMTAMRETPSSTEQKKKAKPKATAPVVKEEAAENPE